MRAERSLLICLALIVLTTALRAEPPLPLDLVPEDACIGIGVRNLAELRTKGDRLLGKDMNFPRPSQLLDMAFGMLELPWKIDEKKPAALVCLSGTLAGLPADAEPEAPQLFGNRGGGYTIGAVLTPKSLDEVAKGYKVKVADLKEGQVRKVPGKDFGFEFGADHAGLHNGLIYLTNRDKATAAWMKARSVRASLPAAVQRRLDAADGLLYLAPRCSGSLTKTMTRKWWPRHASPGSGRPAPSQPLLGRGPADPGRLSRGWRVRTGPVGPFRPQR